MSDDAKATGRCLCGAVTITLTAQHRHVGICHCIMCRRWNGGPNMAIEIGKDIEIAGKEHITAYRSSEWAERAFCKICGSNLYYRILETNDHAVCVGILDDPAELTLTTEIFIDEKPGFYQFANDTKTMTGAEVFAAFTPGGDDTQG